MAVAADELDPGSAPDQESDLDVLNRIEGVGALLAVTEGFESGLFGKERPAGHADVMEFSAGNHVGGCVPLFSWIFPARRA